MTKHGSDVKTQYIQSKKTTIPNNNLGAKAFDRMLMIVLSEVHRGSVTCAEGSNDRLNSCASLENFRIRTRHVMTFRQALNKINNIISDKIKNIECYRQLQDDVLLPNLGTDVEVVSCIAKETCLSPKKNILNRLKSDTALNNDIINRFKQFKGKPMFRVSDVDKDTNGIRAKGICIVCKKRTNWYCMSCRNWSCLHKTESEVKHVVDMHLDSNGHRITAVKSCFMECHPNYL